MAELIFNYYYYSATALPAKTNKCQTFSELIQCHSWGGILNMLIVEGDRQSVVIHQQDGGVTKATITCTNLL